MQDFLYCMQTAVIRISGQTGECECGYHNNLCIVSFIGLLKIFTKCDVIVIMPGIPTLVLLDENDEVITTEGRSVILKDLEGKVSTEIIVFICIIYQCYCCIHLDIMKLLVMLLLKCHILVCYTDHWTIVVTLSLPTRFSYYTQYTVCLLVQCS